MTAIRDSVDTLRYPDPLRLATAADAASQVGQDTQGSASERAVGADVARQTSSKEGVDDAYLSTPPASMLASASGRSPYASPDETPQIRPQIGSPKALGDVGSSIDHADEWTDLSAPSEFYPKPGLPAQPAASTELKSTEALPDAPAADISNPEITSAVEDDLLEGSFQAPVSRIPQVSAPPRLLQESPEERDARRKSWIAGVGQAQDTGRLLHPGTGSGGMVSGPIQPSHLSKRKIEQGYYESDYELGPDDSTSQISTHVSSEYYRQRLRAAATPRSGTNLPGPRQWADLSSRPREVSPGTVMPNVKSTLAAPEDPPLLEDHDTPSNIDASEDLSSAYLPKAAVISALCEGRGPAPPDVPSHSRSDQAQPVTAIQKDSRGTRAPQSELGVVRQSTPITTQSARHSSAPALQRTAAADRATASRAARDISRRTTARSSRTVITRRTSRCGLSRLVLAASVAFGVIALWVAWTSKPAPDVGTDPLPIGEPTLDILPIPGFGTGLPLSSDRQLPVFSSRTSQTLLDTASLLESTATIKVQPAAEHMTEVPHSSVSSPPVADPRTLSKLQKPGNSVSSLGTLFTKPVPSPRRPLRAQGQTTTASQLLSAPEALGPFDRYFLEPASARDPDYLWFAAKVLAAAGILCAVIALLQLLWSAIHRRNTKPTSSTTALRPPSSRPSVSSGTSPSPQSSGKRSESISFSMATSPSPTATDFDRESDLIYKREPSTPPRRVSFAPEDDERPVLTREELDMASQVTLTPQARARKTKPSPSPFRKASAAVGSLKTPKRPSSASSTEETPVQPRTPSGGVTKLKGEEGTPLRRSPRLKDNTGKK